MVQSLHCLREDLCYSTLSTHSTLPPAVHRLGVSDVALFFPRAMMVQLTVLMLVLCILQYRSCCIGVCLLVSAAWQTYLVWG